MTVEVDTLYYLLVALAIGLLIGVERGWQERESREGQRIAGVRTYGLIGLLGGVLALLSEQFGELILGLGFIGVATLIGMIFLAKQRQQGEWGITSLIAALLVYVLAALAATGEVLVASSTAVVAVLLLSYKPLLHGWISHLQAEELRAGIKLLLISVVLLPVLPDEAFGPGQVLNPYRIWWMVVLIATISFVGYFAIKIGGARRGILFTGLFGGLASSTAVTLHLSRLGKYHPDALPVVASGILIACGTMFIRLLMIVGLLEPSLLKGLWIPVALMAVITYLPLLAYHRDGMPASLGTSSTLKNPLELKTALTFGAILASVMILSVFLRQAFGDAGLITLAAVSGIADVDAIVLSLVGMASDDLSPRLFVLGCVVAAAMNNLLKAGMAFIIGGHALGLKVAPPLILSFVIGLLVAWSGV
ncbi:MgtC/SapB family protein [Methylophaga sp. OBS4]|uniref:MgtC/SapB family protein n=1 Tax=Methylophaga sp. OBS4 TaxID=2991935 RepID=UPI00224F011E|nr:MgtC/SapB family protein [Methylophaga sp. OBS4]MCX4186554.1 MgtC/SapB family protein [Methylophaga sp. OBS4]